MRRLLTTTTALLALAAPLLTAAPADAAETIAIKPASLPRGPDIGGPHLDGTTIVDGDVSVALTAANALLFGKYQDDYIVATGNDAWGNVRVWRVTDTGARTLLLKGINPFEAELDADADSIAYSWGDATQKPTIGIFDLELEKETNAKAFASLPTLLEYDDGLVVVSFADFNVKTVLWNTIDDSTTKIIAKQANYVSQAHDLIGYFSKDPFRGGCQVLAKLSRPSKVKWTNCDERIEAVSPDGKRVATIPLLSDGIGTADIVLRTVTGTELVHYTIDNFFGAIWWETNTKLLMQANGKTKAATVRCKVAECNRASALRPPPEL